MDDDDETGAGDTGDTWPNHTGGGPVVNYYFPVVVEVVGTLPDAEVHRVARHVFGELDRELATRV